MEYADFIKVARGIQPAETLLKNVKLINVLTGEIYPTHIALAGTRVVGIGDGYQAENEINLGGRYVCPGFIDAHVHIESAMVPPREFTRAVLPHGVTTVITDPHEIANVLGLEGIRFMLQDAKYGPLSMFVNASSCVPATPMSTAGAQLEFYDLAPLLYEPWVLGLAEVMNYHGVLNGDKRVLEKMRSFKGRVIDGHCPGLAGKDLNAYIAAGVMSDHECTTLDEARQKLRLGLTIFIREATNARNLKSLVDLITIENERRICFCTDDRQPADLLDEGSIDYMVRTAIAAGVEPVTAIRLATINAAEYFRLFDRGVVAPGRRADLVVFSDLHNLHPELVFRGAKLVARDGVMLPWERPFSKTKTRGAVNINWGKVDLRVPANGKSIRVIGTIPDQLVTEQLIEMPRIEDGCVAADPERDMLKMAVIERHLATGNVGIGFIKGFGLKRGAIASTIAHDHHNLVVIGADDQSMMTAARAVADTLGGQAVANGDQVLAQLPLPIAGLMSDRPIEEVRNSAKELIAAAHSLGSSLHDPFMAMSFSALEVIPSLKLTDQGLVDVDRFQIVPIFAD